MGKTLEMYFSMYFIKPRRHQHQKKICSVDFFSKASLVELTNYIIRHISKYGNTMMSFLCTLCSLRCLASLANPSRQCPFKLQTLKVILMIQLQTICYIEIKCTTITYPNPKPTPNMSFSHFFPLLNSQI